LIPEKLIEPLKWSKPQMVFVNSMSDLFQEGVPTEYIKSVVQVMMTANWHTYQILTKRADRMRALLNGKFAFAGAAEHIWWGTSVENRKHGFPRIVQLADTDVRVRFLSIEPLLENLGQLNLEGIHWVIVGGESGPGARPMRKEWVDDILAQCLLADVPFFFKQWGGRQKSRTGRVLNDRTYNNMPMVHRNPFPAKRVVRVQLIEAVLGSNHQGRNLTGIPVGRRSRQRSAPSTA
jgi:protein gp37